MIKVGDAVVNNGIFNPDSRGLRGTVLYVRSDVATVRLAKGDMVKWYLTSCDPETKPKTLAEAVGIPHGGKDDSKKLDMTLLFEGVPVALEGVARVLEGGARKYAAHSWRQVPNGVQRYKAAFLRHLQDLNKSGWDHINTEDFGLPTIDHMLTDLLFIRELLTAEGKIK